MGRIQRALISVSDKTGIVEFSRALADLGVEIVSTGGTASLLRENRIPVKDVSEITGFPEMMDGRVKTLHPRVHGGILALRDNPQHVAQMKQHEIVPIDLVVVNLYPFEGTVARGASFDEIVEKGFGATTERDRPAELVSALVEECQRLLRSLGDAQLQAVAQWKLEGFTNEEIAGKLTCTPRTIERKLRLIRAVWEKEGLT